MSGSRARDAFDFKTIGYRLFALHPVFAFNHDGTPIAIAQVE